MSILRPLCRSSRDLSVSPLPAAIRACRPGYDVCALSLACHYYSPAHRARLSFSRFGYTRLQRWAACGDRLADALGLRACREVVATFHHHATCENTCTHFARQDTHAATCAIGSH